MNLYQKVQQACKEQNLSIMRLEEKLQFPRGSIYKWDCNVPSVLKVKAVADELGKPIEYFLETEPEEN